MKYSSALPWRQLPSIQKHFLNLISQFGVLLVLVKEKLSHSLSECETQAVLFQCYVVHYTAFAV